MFSDHYLKLYLVTRALTLLIKKLCYYYYYYYIMINVKRYMKIQNYQTLVY